MLPGDCRGGPKRSSKPSWKPVSPAKPDLQVASQLTSALGHLLLLRPGLRLLTVL